MPVDPISFIHADNLLLDCPVIVEGDHSSGVLQILEDASLFAFDQLLQTSLDSHIDFLLLTGNSFADSHESLRARTALVEGLQILCEAGIPVFVCPSQLDSINAWNQFSGIPSNVTLIEEDLKSSIIVRLNQKTIATISLTNPDVISTNKFQKETIQDKTSEEIPISIGLFADDSELNSSSVEKVIIPDYFKECQIPDLHNQLSSSVFNQYDYIAVTGLLESRQLQLDHGIANSPGLLQPRTPSSHHREGFSLVRIDSSKNVQIETVSVNPICWQKEEIKINENESKKSFIQKCITRIQKQETNRYEKIRIICLTVSGSDSLNSWFENPKMQKELQQELQSGWNKDPFLIAPVLVTQNIEETDSSPESLLHQFHDAVENELVQSPNFILSVLKKLKNENEGSELLQNLSEKVEQETIIQKSETESRKWFS